MGRTSPSFSTLGMRNLSSCLPACLPGAEPDHSSSDLGFAAEGVQYLDITETPLPESCSPIRGKDFQTHAPGSVVLRGSGN